MSNTGWYYVLKFDSEPPTGPGIMRHPVQGYAEALKLKDQSNGRLSQEDRERGVHWDIQEAAPPSPPVKPKSKRGRSRRQNPSDRQNKR
jgi:hypothetical protein